MAVACLLPATLLVFDQTPLRRFILGKECSYAASAYFHRCAGVGASIRRHVLARQADKLAIFVSIAATGIPTNATARYLLTHGTLIALCVPLVLGDDKLSAGESARRRQLFRACVALQFACATALIGSASQWSAWWALGTACYTLGFALFAARSLSFPWHKDGRNGAHEDFHWLIVCGDACYFANAWRWCNQT